MNISLHTKFFPYRVALKPSVVLKLSSLSVPKVHMLDLKFSQSNKLVPLSTLQLQEKKKNVYSHNTAYINTKYGTAQSRETLCSVVMQMHQHPRVIFILWDF